MMNGHNASMLFTMKCLMKDSPLMVVGVNLLLSIMIFGYTIRIFDQEYSEVSGQNFNTMNNPFWLSVITMTTVGYGAFFPKSNIA